MTKAKTIVEAVREYIGLTNEIKTLRTTLGVAKKEIIKGIDTKRENPLIVDVDGMLYECKLNVKEHKTVDLDLLKKEYPEVYRAVLVDSNYTSLTVKVNGSQLKKVA